MATVTPDSGCIPHEVLLRRLAAVLTATKRNSAVRKDAIFAALHEALPTLTETQEGEDAE